MPTRVILLHGTRFDSRSWDAYPALLPGVELVVPDLPGHGSRVGEPFTLAAALETIDAAVADADPVVVVGHSLGGYLVMEWAAVHPDRAAGLVVVGASADPTGRGAVLYRAFARAIPWVGEERMARWSNAVVARLLGTEAGAQMPGPEAYAALPAAWAAVMGGAGPSVLNAVTCPVWLVNGRLDQLRIDVRRYAAAAADARVVTVPRATHFLPLSHPEAVACVIRAAVRRAEGDT